MCIELVALDGVESNDVPAPLSEPGPWVKCLANHDEGEVKEDTLGTGNEECPSASRSNILPHPFRLTRQRRFLRGLMSGKPLECQSVENTSGRLISFYVRIAPNDSLFS